MKKALAGLRAIQRNRNAWQIITLCLAIISFIVSSTYKPEEPNTYEVHQVFAWLLPQEVRAFGTLMAMTFIRSVGEEIGVLTPEFESTLPAWLWLLGSRVVCLDCTAYILMYLVLLLPVPEDFARSLVVGQWFTLMGGVSAIQISVLLYFLTTWKGKHDRARKPSSTRPG